MGQDVELVNIYRYLGVYLDNNLAWTIISEVLYRKVVSKLNISEETQILYWLQQHGRDLLETSRMLGWRH